MAVRSFAEIEILAEQAKRRRKFGAWKIDRGNKCFEYVPTGYYVDFSRCDTPSKLLDWILHLHAKNWGRASLSDFVAAVQCVMGGSVHPGQQM